MNKTKAFINRVVIGVTLMTLAACALNQQQQDSYNSRAGLMVAQFNEIQEQQPGHSGLKLLRQDFDMYHLQLKSDINDTNNSIAGAAYVQSTCDKDIYEMQTRLDQAITISLGFASDKEKAAKQKADQKAADAAKLAAQTASALEAKKVAEAAAEQEAKKPAEAAAAQGEAQNSSESEATYYNIDATGNTPTQSNQFGNFNQNGVPAPPPPPPPPPFIPMY